MDTLSISILKFNASLTPIRFRARVVKIEVNRKYIDYDTFSAKSTLLFSIYLIVVVGASASNSVMRFCKHLA